MKKWYKEEYEFNVEVTGFLHGDHTESIAVMVKKLVTNTAAPTAAL